MNKKIILHNILNIMNSGNTIHIYRSNDYCEYLPLFHGTAEEARSDEEVFDHLLDDIEYIELVDNSIVIYIHYNERAKDLYSDAFVKFWDDEDRFSRPYRTYVELLEEVRNMQNAR